MEKEYSLTYETPQDKKYISDVEKRVGWLGVRREKIDGGCFIGEINTISISGEKIEDIQRRERYLKKRLDKGILQEED
jgi:hypothetical protein